MLLRRHILICLLGASLSFACATPVLAKDGGGNSGPGGGHGNEDEDDYGNYDDEQYDARVAVETGRALPLREVINVIERAYPGEIIEVRFRRFGEGFAYRFKIIDTEGQVRDITVDALTKQILKIRGGR